MIKEAIIISIIAYVYTQILTEPDMILEWWFNLCKRYLPKFLFEPIVGCVYCVSGQISLWYYLITRWNSYNIINHIVFICLTIFCVEIIMTIKNKTR